MVFLYPMITIALITGFAVATAPSLPPVPTTGPTPPAAVYTRGHITCVENITCAECGHVYKIGANLNQFGVYAPLDASSNDSLVVEMDLAAATKGSANIRIKSGELHRIYPYFGVTTGSEGLDSDVYGIYNYLHLGGTGKTEPGHSVVLGMNSFGASTGYLAQAMQSPIWRYNPTNSQLIPEWVNPDGSRPKLHVVYVPSSDVLGLDNAFAMTTNIASFVRSFDPVKECHLIFNVKTD